MPVLDEHELAAGKLAALMARRASRDIFDAHHQLTRRRYDVERLRLAFVVYGAMNSTDWRTVSTEGLVLNRRKLLQDLIPVLRRDSADAAKQARRAACRYVNHRAGFGLCSGRVVRDLANSIPCIYSVLARRCANWSQVAQLSARRISA